MPRRSDFYEIVSRDFPDGFLASFEEEDRERRSVYHVLDIEVYPDGGEKPYILLKTAEDMPGKVFILIVDDYEIIENDPTMARVTIQGSEYPMIWSDNMSDELRGEMRAARRGGEDLSDEEDPPLRIGSVEGEESASNVEVTEEQAEDPEVGARVLIGDLLEIEDEDENEQ